MYQFIAILIFSVFFIGLATLAGLFRSNASTPVGKVMKYKHVRHGWWNA